MSQWCQRSPSTEGRIQNELVVLEIGKSLVEIFRIFITIITQKVQKHSSNIAKVNKVRTIHKIIPTSLDRHNKSLVRLNKLRTIHAAHTTISQYTPQVYLIHLNTHNKSLLRQFHHVLRWWQRIQLVELPTKPFRASSSGWLCPLSLQKVHTHFHCVRWRNPVWDKQRLSEGQPSVW